MSTKTMSKKTISTKMISTKRMSMKTLWLFDIDGTLININNLHLIAHRKSFENVLCKKILDEDIIKYYGCTGYEFRKSVIKDLGLDCFEKIPEIADKFNDFLLQEFSKSEVKPLPGVKDFLDFLSTDDKNIIGIITGNAEGIGKEVLNRAGIFNYFKIYGFDEGESRIELLRRTINNVPWCKVVVIGDTEKDIAASKANDCITIAVCTGSCSYEDLMKENPDLVLRSMEEFPKIFNYLQTL
jgi:phosphoglycolate phosphatase